ncbi:metallophosphoesterase [Algicola sagamiensis]|uniref:metallophosphoesterase n=1 Tax=Algicola sagamiensis TaxID=163869 RepID=UPI0003670A6A|nr:metallophosphoesterase [Algicola sagamiensis]
MSIFLLLLIAASVFVTFKLSQSTVVKTSGGVYEKILIPDGEKTIRWNTHIGLVADDDIELKHFQGPIIQPQSDGYLVHWYCNNAVEEQFILKNDPMQISCDNETMAFPIYPLEKEASVFKRTPNKIAVVSDLEGDLDFFLKWGRANGVLTKNGDWAYDKGHLVILGDTVDRGRYVYDLLWKIYQLEQEAKRAGGHVHVVLGNHEQYAFQGNVNHVEAEHLWATEQMMPYKDAFSEQTVLGAWLRSKPITLKLGKTLFVHGGISQRVLDQKLSIEALNQIHQKVMDHQDKQSHDYQLVAGPASPTQYRGYFIGTADYSSAPESLVKETKAFYKVKQIVVGHMKVDEIYPKFDRSVYGINNLGSNSQTLVFNRGRAKILDMKVRKHDFSDKDQEKRDFHLDDLKDWEAFVMPVIATVEAQI